MSRTVEVHHEISKIEKEIYLFENSYSNTWEYVGIMYSARDNGRDIWGDKWGKHPKHVKQKAKDFDDLAREKGYKSHDDLCEHHWDAEDPIFYDFQRVENKYNPCCLKTKHDKTRYHGTYFGSQCQKPEPKLSLAEIKAEILLQTKKIKVEL